MPQQQKEKTPVEYVLSNLDKAGYALGGGILANEARKQVVGAKVLSDARKRSNVFDPFRNKQSVLSPKYDPNTGEKQSIFNPERAKRTQEAIRAEAARLRPMRKQAVANVAARTAATRESAGVVRDFARSRPKLPEAVRTAATNLGVNRGAFRPTRDQPGTQAQPKNKPTPEDVKQARRDVPPTSRPKNAWQLRSYAADVNAKANPSLVQRLADKARTPLFKTEGKAPKVPSKAGGIIRTAGSAATLVVAPKLLDMAGNWNAKRIVKNKEGEKPQQPPTGKPTSTQPAVGATAKDTEAKFQKYLDEAIEEVKKEGWGVEEARSYIVNRMKPLGREYHDYALKNVPRLK